MQQLDQRKARLENGALHSTIPTREVAARLLEAGRTTTQVADALLPLGLSLCTVQRVAERLRTGRGRRRTLAVAPSEHRGQG